MASIGEDSTSIENDSRKIVLHVLCPSLPGPNRFTLNEVNLSATVRALKSRISESIPSQPPASSQRLIYRGRPITNDDLTLQSVLEPVESTEYSIHLVLPPAPTSPTSIPPSTSTTSAGHEPFHAHVHQSPFHVHHRISQLAENQGFQSPSLNAPGIRFRGPAAASGPGGADRWASVRRNVGSIRQQVEQQEQHGTGVEPATENAAMPSFNPRIPQQNSWQRIPNSSSSSFNPPNILPGQSVVTTTRQIFTMATATAAPSVTIENINATGIRPPEDSQIRFQILQAQIALCESQLSQGVTPDIEHIINIRTQLLALLDEQYRNPQAPRDGIAEALLFRILNLCTRADQLRVTQSRPTHLQGTGTGHNQQMMNSPSRASLHLLTSPSGYQAMVGVQGAIGAIHPSPPAPVQVSGAAYDQADLPELQANGDTAVLNNVVRQAVLNRPVVGVRINFGATRYVRRIWLFVRLYFFCYMFSEPGTWTRMFLVTLAAIISLVSDTDIPRRLYGMVVTPVQRHVESLVHAGPHRDPRPEQYGQGGPSDREERGAGNDLLRRMERSVALFLASLVPGVGERHVEVRNAAEAAERARAEEQRREEEARLANATQRLEDENSNHGREGEQRAATDHNAQTNIIGDGERDQSNH